MNLMNELHLMGCFPQIHYSFEDKDLNVRQHISYMLDRTQSMFKYDGLPDTIPAKYLELFLQTSGVVCVTEVNGDLYAMFGGMGGEPDAYYRPTIFTVANPALHFTRGLTIGQECEVICNDSMYNGLLPLFTRYATGMVENELSMNLANVNSRILSLISAGDDRTKMSAEKYLKDVLAGKQGIIAENAFLDGIRCQPYSVASGNRITDLIEYEQYLKASWYNELGLNANYNMKRESINSGESQLNNDALLPLVDDMLRNREEGVDRVNRHYGTHITVSLASAWEDNQEELDAEQTLIEDEPKEGDSDAPVE